MTPFEMRCNDETDCRVEISDRYKNATSLDITFHDCADLASKHQKLLVLLAFMGSSSDLRAIGTMLKFSEQVEGEIHCVVQPFFTSENNAKWGSDLKDRAVSPIWLAFVDGKCEARIFGSAVIERLKGLFDARSA